MSSSRTSKRAATSSLLRWGDLAFLHVHPVSEQDITFEVRYPAPGTYRLFLQYSVEGLVCTAAFTTTTR